MRKRSGFTLVETLIVIGVIAVLSGIAFVAGASARESGRQAACATQLKSIYASLALYAGDYDDGNAFPELRGLAYVGSRNRNLADVLGSYGFHRDFLHCPSASVRMKERLGSSFMWPITIETTNAEGGVSQAREVMISRGEALGARLPVVECHIHDELFYAPSERHIDPVFASPFRINLTVSGSVIRGRSFPPRTSVFSELTYSTRKKE